MAPFVWTTDKKQMFNVGFGPSNVLVDSSNILITKVLCLMKMKYGVIVLFRWLSWLFLFQGRSFWSSFWSDLLITRVVGKATKSFNIQHSLVLADAETVSTKYRKVHLLLIYELCLFWESICSYSLISSRYTGLLAPSGTIFQLYSKCCHLESKLLLFVIPSFTYEHGNLFFSIDSSH